MSQSILSGVRVGIGAPVRIMGVINASPESFFKGSIHWSKRSIADAARRMQKDGADFIDIGAMSTAPYLKTQISEQEEARRLASAISAARRACSLPISADTSRNIPAKAALEAGATILNDITGLRNDERLLGLLKKFRGLALMAHPLGLKRKTTDPINATIAMLRESLETVTGAGFPLSKTVVDPGIGFFRNAGMTWWKWDATVLRDLNWLRLLPAPLLVGVSRKSFIGEILKEKNPQRRLAGSLAATAAAVINGAAIIRTHDVKETREAVRVAEQIRGQRKT